MTPITPRSVVTGSVRNCIEAYSTYQRNIRELARWIEAVKQVKVVSTQGLSDYLRDGFDAFGPLPTVDQVDAMVEDILDMYESEEEE